MDRLQGSYLQGKKALVTGGVRRLGRAFALALAAEGADVVVTTRVLDVAAKDLLDEISALGVKAHAVACDVTRADQVIAAVSDAVGLLGGLDLLVNNAGAFETASLDSLDIKQWDDMFAVNVRGPFLVAQAALPHLQASAGRIINIGSLGGMKPWVTHGHYCASKAAMHSLSQTMAKAWAPQVSVNCIAPGMITFPGEAPRMADKTPMQRDGSAADVVAAVLFFATAPEFITGQIFAVDGGLSLA
jgi:NAD(P)-dependent dehydrogenase (short-subunit alcohol dehydrogenase family)